MAYRVDCPEDDCGFSIVSNDKDELVAVLRSHARDHHDRTIDESEAEGLLSST